MLIIYAKEDASEESDAPAVSTSNRQADNFNASGFGGYLAPYALAVVASILATGAFFKFVLLDC
jgi:hypothetical protein